MGGAWSGVNDPGAQSAWVGCPDPMASWFETRGVAALLTMRILDLILRSRAKRGVSKDEATELNNALTSDSRGPSTCNSTFPNMCSTPAVVN